MKANGHSEYKPSAWKVFGRLLYCFSMALIGAAAIVGILSFLKLPMPPFNFLAVPWILYWIMKGRE